MKNRILLFFLLIFPSLFAKATTILDSVTHISVFCVADTNNYSYGAIYISTSISSPSFSWSGPGSFSSTSQNLTGLVTPGQYTVSVTDKFGAYEHATFSLGYYTDYSFFTSSSEVTVNNRPALKNTSGVNDWCRGAGSKNVLAAGVDGWAEYKATVTNTHRIFGFSEYLTISHCWSYMNYGVYLKNNGYLYRVISGTQTYIGTYAVNDMIRVARVGTNLVIYKNGTAIDTYSIGTTGQNKNLLLEASIWSSGGLLENIGVSFKPPMSLDINVSNLYCGDTLGGSISVTPCGSETFSYDWSSLGDTNSLVTGLGTGSYPLTITDANNWMVKQVISLGYDLPWTNLYNASVDEPTKTFSKSDTSSSWNSGANSYTILPANTDGWVEYEFLEVNTERAIGWTQSPVSTHPITSLDYGVLFYSDQSWHKVTTGTIDLASLGEIKDRDIIRVAREGSYVYCYQNGFKLGGTSVNAAELLYIEAFLYSPTGQFEKVRSSVSCDGLGTLLNLSSDLPTSSVQLPSVPEIRFRYFEHYDLDKVTYLHYNVYDQNRNLVASMDSDGTQNVSGSPGFQVHYGLNVCTLSFAGLLTTAGDYLLEVITPKNDKLYLRFKL